MGRKHKEILVENLPEAIDSAMLETIYEQYGNVVDREVYLYGGLNLGFGFVKFDTAVAARNAINETDGKILMPNSTPLIVAFAHSKRHAVASLFSEREETACCLDHLRSLGTVEPKRAAYRVMYERLFVTAKRIAPYYATEIAHRFYLFDDSEILLLLRNPPFFSAKVCEFINRMHDLY